MIIFAILSKLFGIMGVLKYTISAL